MRIPRWFFLSILVAVLWGGWGALIELPEKHFSPGFPGTLGYIVWSLTMMPCAAVALRRAQWRLDHNSRALIYGALVGLTGAAGQLALFRTLHDGPAYLIFPIISLAPVITIVLAFVFLKERTHWIAAAGVLLSLVAILFLSIQPPDPASPLQGYSWLIGTLAVFFMWGMQSYLAKASAEAVSSESLFFYMATWSLAMSPVAWWMTDFGAPINWSASGPYLAALVQFPNALGALLSIYALRSGKAMIVSPTINGLYPVITIVLSLAIYARLPERWNAIGMALAIASIVMMSYGEALPAQRSTAELKIGDSE
jgi:drug/metabolite transporter (DMT)-like permease